MRIRNGMVALAVAAAGLGAVAPSAQAFDGGAVTDATATGVGFANQPFRLHDLALTDPTIHLKTTAQFVNNQRGLKQNVTPSGGFYDFGTAPSAGPYVITRTLGTSDNVFMGTVIIAP